MLGVGLLGAGTVGREVARTLLGQPPELLSPDAPDLRLKAVAVRNAAKPRRGIPADLLTDAPAHVVADPDIDVVVELMGGDEPARTLISAALAAGKAVVTANKHVLAHHGPELEAIARRAGSALRFEASVGGGIPVLTPLAAQLAPSGLVILARLAFGMWADPGDIVRSGWTAHGVGSPGISGVSREELAGASASGLAIKLIADARRLADGSVSLSVQPTAVPLADPIARIRGVTNRVEVRAEKLGSVAFSGPGAGGPATSAAVIADLLAIARDGGSTWASLEPATDRAPAIAGPLEEAPDRGWFAFIPGTGKLTLADEGASSVRTEMGTAIHLRCGSLADMRRLLREAAPRVRNVTIYPADEQAPAAVSGVSR